MRRAMWVWAGSSLLLFAIDRLTRDLAFRYPGRVLVPFVLESRPTINTGIAFGLPLPAPIAILLIGVLLGVVVGLAYSAYRHGHVVRFGAAVLVGVGAVSNVLDRLSYGAVRDFLKWSFLPSTANLGDWMITVGAVVLILASVPMRHTRSNTR